jgi:uncharacterized protein (UPF0332 family)
MEHQEGRGSPLNSPFLRKAEIGVNGAKVLLDLGDTDGACSRAYYAMYDAARATLAWAGIAPERGAFKTHSGLIAAFSRGLVKPGLFPAELGRAIQRALTVRQIADYEASPVPHSDAVEIVRMAESFVATAAKIIAEPYRPPTARSPS